MKNLKIKVHNASHSEHVQKELFSLGMKWVLSGQTIQNTENPYLYVEDSNITYGTSDDVYFRKVKHTEVTLEELQKMSSDKKRPHKHADLIKQWADGCEIQRQVREGMFVDDYEPTWNVDKVYRVKPECPADVEVYGVEVGDLWITNWGLLPVVNVQETHAFCDGYAIWFGDRGTKVSKSHMHQEKYELIFRAGVVNKLHKVVDNI